MKFAEINYSHKKEDFGIHKFFLKLPDSIINWYLLHYPFYIQEMTLEQAEGYKVKIYQKAAKIEKLMLELQQKEVDVLLTNCDIPLPSIIDVSYGNIINSIFVLEAAQKAIKRQSKTLQESKFLIIDGKNRITNIVLDALYPYINYLSIYTDKPENFSQKEQEIYEEYGLQIEFFSEVKSKLFQEFNVIINCSFDMDNYDYKIQKNAFFFDVVYNKEKLRRLMARRNDLLLSNGLYLKWKNKTYLSKQIEAIFRVTEHSFYRFLHYDYYKEMFTEIRNLFQQEEMSVTALTCFERRI